MKGSRIEVRRAGEADLAGIAAVRLSNGPAHADSGVNADYCRYLITHGHLYVAADPGTGRILGFGGAVDTDRGRLLSDLFVHRDAHGRGVGAALLAEVLAGSDHRYTFATHDPRALPLYMRAGMTSRWMLLAMSGPSRALEDADRRSVTPGHELALECVTALAAADAERSMTGVGRASAHEYWGAREGARALVARVGGELVGVAAVVVEPEIARIDHLAASDGWAIGVVAAVARSLGRATVSAEVPGDRPLATALLDVGFTIDDTQVHMASKPDLVDARLQVVHPGLG